MVSPVVALAVPPALARPGPALSVLASPVPVRPVLAPGTTGAVLAYALGGVLLGACSGLTPGLHANNFAMLLAAVASGLPGSPTAVGAAMLAAGVVHTFLDAIPALALGVPDAAMAASALPGHRLVLDGRGREAIRLSALGSGLAVAVAVPLAVPVTALVERHRSVLEAATPLVLAGTVVVLVATEPSVRAAVGGGVSFLLAAGLGSATLGLDPSAPLPAGGVLTPLFAGLFGAPVLLDALGGGGVPAQGDPAIRLPRWSTAATALAGTAAGAFVGYLPGVSAAVAATLALSAAPTRGPRAFLVASSGANTAVAVFALFALAALGTPRTGVTVAIQSVGAGTNLPVLVVVAAIAATAGTALVVTVGDPYLRVVGNAPQLPLIAGVLVLLAALSVLFSGPIGLGILAVATLVGLVPPRLGCRRVHLMGVLLGPILGRELPSRLLGLLSARLPRLHVALPPPFGRSRFPAGLDVGRVLEQFPTHGVGPPVAAPEPAVASVPGVLAVVDPLVTLAGSRSVALLLGAAQVGH
jgi:putative membrane protein